MKEEYKALIQNKTGNLVAPYLTENQLVQSGYTKSSIIQMEK